MSKFRGQYMDMVHPSGDVQVADKPNNANLRQVVKTVEPVSPPPEPEPDTEPKAVEPETPRDILDDGAYESPFLTDVEVEKRPIGGASTTEAEPPANNGDDNQDDFNIDDFIDISQPELPADDGGKGELEPELPAGDEIKEVKVADAEPEEPKETKTTSLANDMVMPQRKVVPAPEPTKPVAPFAHASNTPALRPTKKSSPVWAWILLFFLLAILGAAIGALVYLSGWMNS